MGTVDKIKKAELQAMATELGVSAEGLKNEIEERITSVLQANPTKYSSDDRFSPFLSPRKRAANRSTPARAQRQSPSVESDDDSAKHSPEIDDDESTGDDEENEMAKAKAKVQETMDVAREYLEDWYYAVWEWSEALQTTLSSMYVVNVAGGVFEFVMLMHTLVPLGQTRHEYLWPLFKVAPQFGRLLDWELFWKPYLVWLAFQVVVPLAVAHYVNFRATSGGNRRKSKAKAANAVFDPLVFALSKLLLSYVLFHDKLVPFVGWCDCLSSGLAKTGPLLHHALGDVPLITGAVGTVVAIYSATLL